MNGNATIRHAGTALLAEAGVDAGDVGLLINTSVTRAHLEPSVASKVHVGWACPPPR